MNSMNRILVVLAGAGTLAACQQTPGRDAAATGPSFSVSEGRFGGNPDFFFAAPLGATPQAGDPNFDVGGSNGALRPYVHVCETDGANSPAGCLTDVSAAVTGSATGLVMTYGSTAELYQVNWSTKPLDPAKSYRIEIWGLSVDATQAAAARAAPPGTATVDQRWLFGWRDIANSPSVANCDGTEAFCLVNYGKTIPVKSRIEQFVFCPVDRNCAVQFVAAGTDANLQALLPLSSGAPSAQLFVPGQNGTDFALAFEPCTAAENTAVSNATDLPTFGPCLKTLTTFNTPLVQAATLSVCNSLDTSSFDLADPNTQLEQIALHHFSSDLTHIKALPEDHNCTDPTSGGILASSTQSKGLLSLAAALLHKVRSLVMPQPLLARIDEGGGGQTSDLGSFFKLALPAKFEYVSASDASQSGVAGSTFTLKAKVTDLFGGPVKNARVHWATVTPPAEGATVTGSAPAGPMLTSALGIAQNTVTLSSSTGLNVFHAYGRGIADPRNTGCTIPPSTSPTASCNGPRTATNPPPSGSPYGAYDPFFPLHPGPAFSDGSTVVGTSVDIAEGTFLPFSIFGCTPGHGTATVDGNFSSAEWACARQYNFTANVSGGATPAVLYVMNDANNLYLAVRLLRSSSDKVNTLQFNFDNNDSWTTNASGAAETGDDILSLDAVTGFVDAFLTLKCTTSSQSSCWATDASAGGVNNGSGKSKNDGTYTTYEVSHPLNTSDDAHDFSLVAGGKVGLFLTLQTGSGAAGNTQWPGFRKFQEITIVP